MGLKILTVQYSEGKTQSFCVDLVWGNKKVGIGQLNWTIDQ